MFDDVPTLLLVLEESVRADPGPSELRGSVAIGVRTASATRWWTAQLGPEGTRSALDAAAPAHPDATLVLDAAAAETAVAGAALDPERVEATGDLALLEGFIGRYLSAPSRTASSAAPGSSPKVCPVSAETRTAA